MSKVINSQEIRAKILINMFNKKKETFIFPIFLEDIEVIFGFKRSKIFTLEKEGKFPKHKQLHKNYWDFNEVKKAYHDFFKESK